MSLYEQMIVRPPTAGTVGALREVLAGLPDDTPLGEARVIDQGENGPDYEVLESIHVFAVSVKPANGFRGRLIKGTPEFCPPVSWDDGGREAIVLGRSKL